MKFDAKHNGVRCWLGSLEAQVAEALWDKPKSTVIEIAQHISETTGQRYNDTSITTIVDRMTRKKNLMRRLPGRPARYEMHLDEAEFLRTHIVATIAALLEIDSEVVFKYVDAHRAVWRRERECGR